MVLMAVIAGVRLFGTRVWYNSAHYVSADNAEVVEDLIQVGSVNAGRIIVMNVDVALPSPRARVIPTVIPTVISKPDTAGTSKLAFRDVQDQYAEVIATRYGIIPARRV